MGAQKQKKPGFLRISFFLRFQGNSSQESGFGGGHWNSCFWTLSQEVFAGIHTGQEFLYLLRIPLDSSGFLFPPNAVMLRPADKVSPKRSLTSKLTTLQTPKHAPKHVVYSMQYHGLLQLNLNTKILRCCCRGRRPSLGHLPFCRSSSLISSPQIFAWRWRDRSPSVHLQFALAGCPVASCCSTSTSSSRLYDALPPSRVLLQ